MRPFYNTPFLCIYERDLTIISNQIEKQLAFKSAPFNSSDEGYSVFQMSDLQAEAPSALSFFQGLMEVFSGSDSCDFGIQYNIPSTEILLLVPCCGEWSMGTMIFQLLSSLRDGCYGGLV